MGINEYITPVIEEQATGCAGVGNYRDYAHKAGYKCIEVLNWSSSAGDWQFIISKDKKAWQVLDQVNNWPRAGFTYTIDDQVWYGTAKQVLKDIYNFYY